MYFLYLDMLHNYRNVDNSLSLKGAKKIMFSPFCYIWNYRVASLLKKYWDFGMVILLTKTAILPWIQDMWEYLENLSFRGNHS